MNKDQMTLFENDMPQPLPARLRPQTIDEIVGQQHLLGEGRVLRRIIEQDAVSSMIFWGPPGVGKTTLAGVIANHTKARFINFSAVTSGIKEIKEVMKEADESRRFGEKTILFVDEIHRFNRAQQDGFLPYVENGTVLLVGATTENPSFELNGALLSRCKVSVMKALDRAALAKLAARAEELTGRALPLDAEAKETLMDLADGDGRYFINLMESVYDLTQEGETLDRAALTKIVQQRAPAYDKDREGHYNLISALHKSLRGSDTDAAMYYAARMLRGGEDPLYLLRRLTRFAMEDIGLADPAALPTAIAAWDAYERLGSPEGEIAIFELVAFLGTAPKSNACYRAQSAAMKAAKEYGSLNPPAHILNAPTKLMANLGYGRDYCYDHDTPEGFSGQNYFPDGMARQRFYRPVERGFEREILRRIAYWDKLRREKNADATGKAAE